MAKKYPFSNERREGFGNLSQDPKKISGKNSKTTVVALTVAVNSQNVDRDGDVIERADFYNIKLFGRDADLALTNLEKGDRIHFKGRVFPTEYVNRDDELVESVEINADMGEVYPAPLWESFDTNNDDDEDDEDDRPARRSRKSSKRKASKRRRKEEEEAQDWDDDEDLDDEEDLDDDFEEDAAPKRPTRSRSRSRSRKKSSDVDVDDDADEYEDLI